jgi:hypothetical protein
MKTLFANNDVKNFDNFAFDVLTVAELSCIKGGGAKEDDSYADPTKP